MTNQTPGGPGPSFRFENAQQQFSAREWLRFQSSFDRPSDGCWLWKRVNESSLGYGRFFFRGEQLFAHRFVYEVFVGPIPEGLELDHLCRNRDCVRPDHLEPVTHAENMKRGMDARGLGTDNPIRKPRTWIRGNNDDRTLLTHCRKGHEYTPENTYVVPNRDVRARRCRECLRAGQKKERARIGIVVQNRRAAAANTAPETIDALVEATAAHLRLVGKWQPGTIAQLLADLPGAARMERLVGGVA